MFEGVIYALNMIGQDAFSIHVVNDQIVYNPICVHWRRRKLPEPIGIITVHPDTLGYAERDYEVLSS